MASNLFEELILTDKGVLSGEQDISGGTAQQKDGFDLSSYHQHIPATKAPPWTE